jgi:hypothetical protein
MADQCGSYHGNSSENRVDGMILKPNETLLDNPTGGHAEQKLLPEHLGNFNDLYANAFKPQCRKTIGIGPLQA